MHRPHLPSANKSNFDKHSRKKAVSSPGTSSISTSGRFMSTDTQQPNRTTQQLRAAFAHTCPRTHIRHQLPPLYIRRLGCFCKAYLMIHASSQSYTVPLWSGEMWVYSGTETTCPNFHLFIMSSSEKWKSITENQVS